MSPMRDTASILPLRFEGVSFSVDGKDLVRDLDLTIERGDTTVLLGPNGAGKSVLLRLAHGLLAPSRGRIDWAAGEGVSIGRRRHAMVFQKPVMLRRSAHANLTHALAAAGLGWRARRDKADETLEHFRLAHLSGRPARRMSGGEQQRLAIARAWALDPELLFLDEPTSALDPAATRTIEEMLMGLKAEGRTLMMASHDLGQARRLATRIVFLNRGRIVESGPAELFFARPRTKEAASFLDGELI
jgi:tungstate transport system ATP-binding protein